MNSIVFTTREATTLHKTTRFLRRLEMDLPGNADPKHREGVLHAALALEEQADNLNSGPASTLRETRRPLFNHLVAPVAGGIVFPDEAKAMLDAHEDAARTEGAQFAELRIKAALLKFHPKTANPTHGCCAPPKACNGHGPQCRSSDHGLDRKSWPCGTLRVVGITSDADADAVLAALAGPEGCPRNVIDGNVGRHFFKKGALSDSPIACIYCGNLKPDENSA
ncbi:hypothetical protein [Streptomyces sp. NPDC005538]|uniref:hypothetical protein n=1 Tax=Streptomyces sp. NPDC005538 TaxID=3157043 RepID=UPI00339F88B9